VRTRVVRCTTATRWDKINRQVATADDKKVVYGSRDERACVIDVLLFVLDRSIEKNNVAGEGGAKQGPLSDRIGHGHYVA
jgi:hypothetical protein